MTEHSVKHATFVIERSYPVLPAKVFAAYADAAAREVWMDDPDYKSDGSKYELDFQVGGHERLQRRHARRRGLPLRGRDLRHRAGPADRLQL